MKKILIPVETILLASFLMASAIWCWGSTANSYRIPISQTSTNVVVNTNMTVNTLWIRVVGDDFYCDTDTDSTGASTSSAMYPNGTVLTWEYPAEIPRYVRMIAVNSNATAHVQRSLR